MVSVWFAEVVECVEVMRNGMVLVDGECVVYGVVV